MTSIRRGLAAALVTIFASAGVLQAQLVSDEWRTGSLLGAMKYCRENHTADGKEERKYKRVSRDALKKLDEMPDDEKEEGPAREQVRPGQGRVPGPQARPAAVREDPQDRRTRRSARLRLRARS